MQNTTADYKLEINRPSRSFECKVIIGDNIYKNEDIVDIILEYPQPQEGFSIGSTVSQTLDLTLINKGDTIYSTSQVKVEIGLKIGSTIEYILMGIFNIDDIVKTDYTTKFTCYDNMIKFETAYFSSLGDKPTLQQVVNELASKTGVQFTGSLPAYTVSKLEGFTCREVLSYVASICGGNALITREGKFTIKSLVEVEKSIDANNYFEYKREEVKYKIGKISCQVDENNILSKGSIGSDSMELQFENPWANETILTDIYNKLNGLSYLGYSMKWQGDLSLDPYDVITVTDKKGTVRKEPILSQKFTYTGGLTSEIEAKGETKNKNSFSSSGSTTNKVNRLVTEQAVIKEALIEKANISDLVATNAEIANLKVKHAEIEEAIIDVAHIEDLTAINASIANLVAADANITNLIATKADITDLTATNIKFNVGSGGTLDLQTLLSKFVTGENGQFLNITSSNVVIANAVIKDAMIESLSVDKLLAGRISTNKFTVSSDNGGIEIVGATQQFKDKNNKVRIQMGQDATGNFNFILRGEDGTTTLIDHTGIKENAIADKLIKSNMVADNAIGEKQINYSSLITGLNKDTNTQLIKASKVAIDLTGQSLEVSFNSLKSNVDEIQVGTRNLLKGTSNFDEEYWENVITIGNLEVTNGAQSDVIKYNNHLVAKVAGDYASGKTPATLMSKQGFKFEIGKTYVISVMAKATILGFKLGVTLSGNHIGYKAKDIGTDWKQYSWIYESTNDTLQRFRFEGIGSFDENSYIFIAEPIITLGNKIVDYSPAPEDVEQKIESNTTAVSVMQGKIETLIKNTTIEKDGTTTTLKDAYSSLKQTVDGINTTVASHTTSISTIQNTANSALANANTANSKIDGLEIGGRNLVLNSAPKTTSWNWAGTLGTMSLVDENTAPYGNAMKATFTATGTSGGMYKSPKVKLTVGVKYSWSVWIKASRNIAMDLGMEQGGTKRCSVTTSWQKFTHTFTATNTSNYAFIMYARETVNSGDYYLVHSIKVEEGNKATDWTPAPEDVDTSINTLSGKVTTVENKYTSLEQNLNGFKTTVANSYSTKTELSNVDGKVTSLTSRVSTAESSITQLNNKIALKVEATDVANAINSINSENLVVDGSFENGYGWTGDVVIESGTGVDGGKCLRLNAKTTGARGYSMNKSIDVLPGKKYKLSVWYKTSSDNNGNSDNQKVRLGYENGSLLYAMYLAPGATSWTYKEETVTIPSGTYRIKLSVYTNTSSGYILIDNLCFVSAELEEKITTTNNKVASIETSLNGITQTVSSHTSTINTHTTQLGTVDSRINTAKNAAIDSSVKYTDGEITTVNQTISDKVADIKITTDSIKSRVSSTEQSISTINGNISSLQTRISNAEQKITDSAIISTVQSTINQAKTDAINSANTNTANKLKNYSTTTQMNTAITQSANSIKSEVSNSYLSKSDATNTYATKSSLTQTSDSIIAKFEETGGYNLIRNSTGLGGTNNWRKTADATLGIGRNTTALSTATYMYLEGLSDTTTRFAYSSRFKLQAGQQYSFSSMIHNFTKCSGFAVQLLMSTAVDETDTGVTYTNSATLVAKTTTNGAWQEFKKTITIPTGVISGYVRVVHYGYNSAGSGSNRVNWSAMQFEEGSSCSKWSPHPSEVYDGSTIIDANGVTINNGALTVKNKSGTTVLQGDSNGNLKLSIFNSTFEMSATGARKTQMSCDVLDKFHLKVPFENSGAGFKLETDTGKTFIEATAGTDYLSIPIWTKISTLSVNGDTYVAGNFSVGGSKNSLQSTQSYGERLINAYETAEYYFGDIGSGVIKNGECLIYIDDILQECINTDCEYHVFTQVYSGSITKIERYKNYFIVYGEDNTEFSWELKAKRLGYENVRLDVPEIEMNNEDYIIEDILNKELDFKLEDILLEVA